MTKRFYLFKQGSNYRLQEIIAGSPTDAMLARGVADTSPKLSVLLNAIGQVAHMLSDPLRIGLCPPPKAGKDCVALDDEEKKQARAYLDALDKQIHKP